MVQLNVFWAADIYLRMFQPSTVHFVLAGFGQFVHKRFYADALCYELAEGFLGETGVGIVVKQHAQAEQERAKARDNNFQFIVFIGSHLSDEKGHRVGQSEELGHCIGAIG